MSNKKQQQLPQHSMRNNNYPAWYDFTYSDGATVEVSNDVFADFIRLMEYIIKQKSKGGKILELNDLETSEQKPDEMWIPEIAVKAGGILYDVTLNPPISKEESKTSEIRGRMLESVLVVLHDLAKEETTIGMWTSQEVYSKGAWMGQPPSHVQILDLAKKASEFTMYFLGVHGEAVNKGISVSYTEVSKVKLVENPSLTDANGNTIVR